MLWHIANEPYFVRYISESTYERYLNKYIDVQIQFGNELNLRFIWENTGVLNDTSVQTD